MNIGTYATNLALAGQAEVSSIRTSSLQKIMQEIDTVDGRMHAAFQEAWSRAASSATLSVARALKSHSAAHGASKRRRALVARP